jgi:hypothetical protein
MDLYNYFLGLNGCVRAIGDLGCSGFALYSVDYLI